MGSFEKKILVARDEWRREVKLCYLEILDGKRSIARSMVMEPLERGQAGGEFVSIDEQTAQGLFDQLWELGFRPADGTGNGGHIKALNDHLGDMRALVFKTKPQEKL